MKDFKEANLIYLPDVLGKTELKSKEEAEEITRDILFLCTSSKKEIIERFLFTISTLMTNWKKSYKKRMNERDKKINQLEQDKEKLKKKIKRLEAKKPAKKKK